MSKENINTGSKIDRYIIEKILSDKGGTAIVCLGYLENDSQFKVAIKIAKTDANGATHEDVLLQHESELLQKWDWRHPGIVRLLPIQLVGRNPEYAVKALNYENHPWFMVMEYLRGDNLKDNLNTIQKYPLNWRLELFYQILMPIAFLHQKGFAHRDFKA